MNRKILKLPEVVINQIAAGEVVENPASIVKELVENSLDAGARRIVIESVGGGGQLIRIEDDGCGMGPEDALACLERHATSKLRAVEDLEALGTLGFRGEALAAIASVSHLTLQTCAEVGTAVYAEGGIIQSVKPCARNRGTTLEIRSLFYNVPARKKFQKSASANTAQIARVIETTALAHPEVTFVWNGKTEYGATSQEKRIEEILGGYEHQIQGTRVHGFVAAPSKASSTRLGQYLFINRRPVFSPLIAKAVKMAFGTRIAEHAYPPFVLFLEISPDQVDVNVHPQKKEVRFKEESSLFQEVQKAVEAVFMAPPTHPVSFSFQEAEGPSYFSFRDEPPLLVETTPPLPLIFSDRLLAVVGSYLLLQKEALLAIDLRAVYARLLFDACSSLQQGVSQPLLWPLPVELHPEDEGRLSEWNQWGLECRSLGPKMGIIDALPPWLEAADVPLFLEQCRQNKGLSPTISSFSRRVKKQYSLEEARTLWMALQKSSDSLYDPLGNRIWKEIKLDELFSHG